MAYGKLIAYFAVILILTGTECQQQQRYVILPPSAARTIPIRLFDDSIHLGTWQPPQADIDSLEANLSQVPSLKPQGWTSTIHIEKPEHYFRQYIGATVRRNKLIYVNAFCDAPPQNWETQLYIVMDGGTCFWQAFYDPATKTFSNLMIKGRA